MGVQMNIKNAEAAAIAAELAAQDGTSVTQVVLEALRDAKRRREKSQEERLARVMAICRDTAARMKNKISSEDIDALLYDEWGLPK